MRRIEIEIEIELKQNFRVINKGCCDDYDT
jgi:hypothetical protein